MLSPAKGVRKKRWEIVQNEDGSRVKKRVNRRGDVIIKKITPIPKEDKQKEERIEQNKRDERVSRGLKPGEAKVTEKVAKLQSKIDRVSDEKDARQQQQKEKGFRKKTRKEKLLMKQVDAPRLNQKAKDRFGERAKKKEGNPQNNDGDGTGSRGSKSKSRNLKEKIPVFQKMKIGKSLKPFKGKKIK